MTIVELEAKRTEILNRIGIASASFGDRSVQYSDAVKALAVLDAEISRANAVADGGSRYRASYVSFTK